MGPRQPLPDEVLDALVMVLDEVRLGRSLSRSELVVRTGLGRAIARSIEAGDPASTPDLPLARAG